MPKKEKETAQDNGQIATYKGKEYNTSEWTEEQINNANHVLDLERKLKASLFNVEQLKGGLAHFEAKLDEELRKKEEKDE